MPSEREEIEEFEYTREKEIEEFEKYLKDGIKYIIIKGIYKVGKTDFMRRMPQHLLSKTLENIPIYRNASEIGHNDLRRILKDILKELNDQVKQRLNRMDPIIPDFDNKYDSKGPTEIINKIFEEVERNNCNLKAFIFIDEIKMTEDYGRLLENIVNGPPRNLPPRNFLHIILSPINYEFRPLSSRCLRIRCVDDEQKTERALKLLFGDTCNNNLLSELHRKYRGHLFFIQLAFRDCSDDPSQLHDNIKSKFENMYGEVSRFLDNVGHNDIIYWITLIILFKTLLICEQRVRDFKGIKSYFDEYRSLPLFERISDEIFENTIRFTQKCFCGYLEEEGTCIKLYPLLVEWFLENKLNNWPRLPGNGQYSQPAQSFRDRIEEYCQGINVADVCCNHIV